MAKFYIATSLLRQKEHNLVRDYLISKGHQITYDWTIKGSQKYTSLEVLKKLGHDQKTAVETADAVIVLLPGGKGTHSEFGIALSAKKPIILHSKTETPFTLGEEICAFYCCDGIEQVVGNLEDCLEKIEMSLSGQVIASI